MSGWSEGQKEARDSVGVARTVLALCTVVARDVVPVLNGVHVDRKQRLKERETRRQRIVQPPQVAQHGGAVGVADLPSCCAWG